MKNAGLPIRIRLAGVYCAVLFVMIVLIEFGTYWAMHAAIDSIVDSELRTRLAAVEDHITRHVIPLGWPGLRGALRAHPGFQPDYLEIRKNGGERLWEGAAFHGIEPGPFPSGPKFRTPDIPPSKFVRFDHVG